MVLPTRRPQKPEESMTFVSISDSHTRAESFLIRPPCSVQRNKQKGGPDTVAKVEARVPRSQLVAPSPRWRLPDAGRMHEQSGAWPLNIAIRFRRQKASALSSLSTCLRRSIPRPGNAQILSPAALLQNGRFSRTFFLAVISRVKTAETLPAFLNFNRSSSLLRRSLAIQSRGRKLQHGSSLAGNQARNLHNLAVREFKRIVMRVWIGHIDLTKPSNLVIYAHFTEKAEGTLVLDIVVER